MKPFHAVAALLLFLAACATKPTPPRWSARVEPRSETEFVLVVLGDAEVRGEEVPVLMASPQQPWDPRILHLDLRYMKLLDRRQLEGVRGKPVRFERQVASKTAVAEVVIASSAYPTVHVPVTTTE